MRSIYAVISKSQQDVSLEFFSAQISNAENRREILQAELARLKSERTLSKDKAKAAQDEVTRGSLDAAQAALITAIDKAAKLQADIADTREFLFEIESRLASLKESQVARSYLSGMAFNFCPCCLSPVAAVLKDSTTCSLCKTALGTPDSESQLLRMRNELELQIRESTALLQDRVATSEQAQLSIPALRQQFRALERRYNQKAQHWNSPVEDALEKTLLELGSLEQQIKSLYESQKLASVIKSLQERRNKLNADLAEAASNVENMQLAQENRKRAVYLAIASNLSRLLKKDLYRQEEFRTAEQIAFSFEDNTVSVDGSSRFSESSTVVLRHLFHLALLSASVTIPDMRFPRLLMLDGIEDGGIELPRAHRLQEIIAEECASYNVDYQLIMATSQIAPSLDSEKYVVGRRYTEENRAIEIL